MPIYSVRGDVTEPRDVEGHIPLIIHSVNDLGRMGSGVARALYERYPIVRSAYLLWAQSKQFHQGYFSYNSDEREDYNIPFGLGQVQVIRMRHEDPLIANLVGQHGIITDKRFPLDEPPARLWAIEQGLKRVASFIDNCDRVKIAIHTVRMGCGLGGEKWERVYPIIEKVLKDYHVKIYDL